MSFIDDYITRHSIRSLNTYFIASVCVPSLIVLSILSCHIFQDKKYDVINQSMELARVTSLKHLDATRQAQTLLETIAVIPSLLNHNQDDIRVFFKKVIVDNPQYAYLTLARPDGFLNVSSSSTDTSINFNDRDQFQSAIKHKTFAIGRTIISRTTNLPVLPFASPVIGSKGEVSGVLLLGLRLEEYEKFFSVIKITEGTRFLFFDREGTRLFRYPQRDLSPVGEKIIPAAWDVISGSKESSKSFQVVDQTGLQVTYSYIILDNEKDKLFDMGIVVGIPTPKFNKQISPSIAWGFIILIIIAALTLATGYFLSNRIVTTGLVTLENKTSEIIRNQQLLPIEVLPGCKGVVALGESFNRMVDFLRLDREARNISEKALRESEEKYRGLFENAPIGICHIDEQGGFLGVNAQFARMHGYGTPDEFISVVQEVNDTWNDPEDRLRLLHIMERLDLVTNFETHSRHKDGTLFWTSRAVRSVRNQRGNLLYYESYVEDIEARKEAEVASEHARKQLLTVLEQIEAGVFVTDPDDDKILYANSYISNALGLDLIGCKADQVLLQSPEEYPFRLKDGFFANGRAVSSRDLLFTDKRWRLCTGKVTPWFLDKPVILTVVTDITIIKEAEAVRADFERIMHHDLKTPLNGIINLPELIASSETISDEDKKWLMAIRDSGYKMLRLIDSSLSLYKLETGKYQLDLIYVDIVKEFSMISRIELKKDVQAKGLTLAYRFMNRPLSPTDVIKIKGDRTLLPFLLSNLAKNAVEAAPSGSCITISIALGNNAVLSLHNFGRVPVEVEDSFFEKYVTFGKFNGTGLGTYSAKLITEAHGGNITMTTSDEKGTTITVTLPQSQS